MAYDGYSGLQVAVDRGVAFVTIDHPPINLLDLTLRPGPYPPSQRIADSAPPDPRMR
jgi:hypothetical protein